MLETARLQKPGLTAGERQRWGYAGEVKFVGVRHCSGTVEGTNSIDRGQSRDHVTDCYQNPNMQAAIVNLLDYLSILVFHHGTTEIAGPVSN